MELKELYQAQKKLDDLILDRLAGQGILVSTKELLNSRLLAMFVEAGEFCNELASFKYWKQSHVTNNKAIKDEYVDILFFWLSIGNLLDLTAEEVAEAYLDKWKENAMRQKRGY